MAPRLMRLPCQMNLIRVRADDDGLHDLRRPREIRPRYSLSRLPGAHRVTDEQWSGREGLPGCFESSLLFAPAD
jgi:hypothetical protein